MSTAGGQSRPSRPWRLAILASHVVQYHAPLYRELARAEGLEVDVLYLDRAGAEVTFDHELGARMRWDVPLLEGYRYEFLRNLSPAPRRGTWLGRINPGLVPRLLFGRWDAVLVQGYQSISSWLGLGSAQLAGKAVLFRGESCLREPRSRWAEGVKAALLRAVFLLSDRVLYSCRGNREFFLHYGCPPAKLAPIPCAVDNAFFRAGRDAARGEVAALRREIGIPPALPVVLNVGPQDDNKSVDHLLRAVAGLQGEGVEIGLVVVGDGPRLPAFRRLARELGLRHSHFAGFVNQSRISRYYTLADVFALCSAYDASPKVVNEALNFALPIICTERAGTVGDVVLDGENGWVYPWSDLDRLSAALRSLAGDAELRQRMGRRSLELADRWSLEADVAAVRDVLARLRRRGRQEEE